MIGDLDAKLISQHLTALWKSCVKLFIFINKLAPILRFFWEFLVGFLFVLFLVVYLFVCLFLGSFLGFFGWFCLVEVSSDTQNQTNQFYLKYFCCWCFWPEREDGKVSWFWNGILQLNVPIECMCHLLTPTSPSPLLEKSGHKM